MNGPFGRLFDGLRVTVFGGLSLFWLAPVIPMIAIAPEFAQHVAEIDLGMFASKEAFNAQANSDQRWAFAYFKIAGLLIAMLAAARFVGGARKRWWDPRTIAWKQFLIALVLNIGATVMGAQISIFYDESPPALLFYGYQLATLPLMIYLVGPLFGDRTMTLRRAYTTGWVAVILAALYSLITWGPAQLLHQYNHTWAMGQSDAVVWALMVFDSLLVGAMACWMGAALAAGYWLGRPPGQRDELANGDRQPRVQPL